MPLKFNPFTNNFDIVITDGPGSNYEPSVTLATTSNLNAIYDNGTIGEGATLTNNGALAALSIDGETPDEEDRILVKDQTNKFENGIYTVTEVGDASTAWVLTRAFNYDTASQINPGDVVPVVEGTTNSNSLWDQQNEVDDVGTDPIEFSEFTGSGGTVTGPGSSTDNNIAVFNGSSGTQIKDSGVDVTTVLVDGDIGTNVQAWNGDLDRVSSITGTGFAVRNGTTSWLTRSLVAGTGISITNTNGVAGDPTISTTVTDTATANYIVDPNGTKAEYTTIGAAITAASAGETIFIKEGTYNEDLTVSKNLSFVAYGGPSRVSNVTVTGKWTISADCLFQGLILNGDGDVTFAISSNITIAQNCKFGGNVNGSITLSGGEARLFNCSSDGGKHFALTAGAVKTYGCTFLASSTASTVSAGEIRYNTSLMAGNVTSSSTGGFTASNCYITGTITADGSGTHHSYNSTINSGANTAIDVDGTITVLNSNIISSATNAIDGTGEIKYAGLTFSDSSYINTTTQTILFEGPSTRIGIDNGAALVSHSVENNTNSGTGQNANYRVRTGGTNSGTAYFLWEKDSTRSYALGMPNGSSESLVLHTTNGNGVAPTTGTELQVMTPDGEQTLPLQPAFLAYLASGDDNITGAGSEYKMGTNTALTKVFDQNSDFNTNGTFTAPVTGRYTIGAIIRFGDITSSMTVGILKLQTSNRSYERFFNPNAIKDGTSLSMDVSQVADMDAADTFEVKVKISNGAGDTADLTSRFADTNMYAKLEC